MKAILISIRPQHTCNILNGIKLWEIRKRFPKDYVGWVYIYVTKDNKNCLFDFRDDEHAPDKFGCGKADKWYRQHYKLLNGKVVARFWCDKVEPVYKFYVEELCQLACISKEELYKYAGGWYNTDDLLAIHITKLEIFDKPKELSEFYGTKQYFVGCGNAIDNTPRYAQLHRAPQSWCYVEI